MLVQGECTSLIILRSRSNSNKNLRSTVMLDHYFSAGEFDLFSTTMFVKSYKSG